MDRLILVVKFSIVDCDNDIGNGALFEHMYGLTDRNLVGNPSST